MLPTSPGAAFNHSGSSSRAIPCVQREGISRSVVSDSLWPYGLEPTKLLCPWNSPDKNIGVGCHFFLQGIFPTQGSNLGLSHCRQILYRLSHQGCHDFLPHGRLIWIDLHVEETPQHFQFAHTISLSHRFCPFVGFGVKWGAEVCLIYHAKAKSLQGFAISHVTMFGQSQDTR